jgi:hypothetical protein
LPFEFEPSKLESNYFTVRVRISQHADDAGALSDFLFPESVAMVGEHLDLTNDLPAKGNRGRKTGRSFVGVQFKCCDVYVRVYVNRDETAYEGNCPKCAKPVRLQIGPGGTDARFFTAG